MDRVGLRKENRELKKQPEEWCIAENARVTLDQRYNGLVSRYEAAKIQYDEDTQLSTKPIEKKLLEQFLHVVETQELISHFDERLWLSLVVLVTVYSE